MSVGQPASVDGNRSVIAASARPTLFSERNMPQPYLSSSALSLSIYSNGRLSGLLARRVMAVDPVFVMMMPTPMSWNPNPVSATNVITRPMDIIRPVTDHDVHNDSICH